MAKRKIRFGVGDQDAGKRASTYTCWTHVGKGLTDVYFANRSIGQFKVRLHDSGECHTCFDPTFLEKEAPSNSPLRTNRFTDKWGAAWDENGVWVAFHVLVPSGVVTLPIGRETNIRWILPAPDGQSVEITLVLTKPGVKCSNWPGRNSMGTDLVDSFKLEDGATVWVVHRVVDTPECPPLTPQMITEFKSGGGLDWPKGGFRILIGGDSDDGSRFWIETVYPPQGEAT